MLVRMNLVPARVLLVDDEPQQLELRAQVLRLCGFSVLTASGSVEAMTIISNGRERIDVAVLDYQMPIMNGCRLAERLRSCRPEVKIILHSGAIDIPRREMTSVDAFVPKNEGIATLIAQVTEFAAPGTGPPELLVTGRQTCFATGSNQS
jgi:CheY-like chemotaxis protein